MTQEQLEGSAIIANFMGLKYHPETDEWTYIHPKDGQSVIYSEGNPPYYLSWDWLMEACKKFDNIQIINPDNIPSYVNRCNRIDDAVIIYDINETFRELVQGIKWYNQNC